MEKIWGLKSLMKMRRAQRRRHNEFSNNTFSEERGQYSPAGKHTAKPVTSSSNEVPDTVHVNEERLKPKCVKHTQIQRDTRCTHTRRQCKSGNSQKYPQLHAHMTILFYSLTSRFTIT